MLCKSFWSLSLGNLLTNCERLAMESPLAAGWRCGARRGGELRTRAVGAKEVPKPAASRCPAALRPPGVRDHPWGVTVGAGRGSSSKPLPAPNLPPSRGVRVPAQHQDPRGAPASWGEPWDATPGRR